MNEMKEISEFYNSLTQLANHKIRGDKYIQQKIKL